MDLILGLLSALLAICFAVLYRALSHVPPKELKRRARKGDEVAGLLYKSASYGFSVRLVLGVLTLLFAYLACVWLVSALDAWLALPVLALLAIAGAMWVDAKGGASQSALWLAAKTSPALAWLLERLHPLVNRASRLVRRAFPLHVHSGLYEKSDLAELLEKQKRQPDNRIAPGEIDLLSSALTFGDKAVADALVPKRVVKAVSVDESIGPILMGELHASGHSRFPVYESRDDNIVGMLYLHDLVSTDRSGTVREVMKRKLIYVHEDFTLYQTLQAFLKTKQHLFIVVNSFEEYVGVISVEDVLERVIGKLIVDEFDRYDDLRAVASKTAQKDHEAAAKQHAPLVEEVSPESPPEKVVQ